MRHYGHLLTALTLTAVVAAGCTSSDPDGDGATIVDQPSGTAATQPADTGDGKPGTRDNPVPAGTTVQIGDWEITLGPTVQDATAQIRAENQFNEPPDAGKQFVMVPVEVTYTGKDSGTPLVGLLFKFLGSAGNTFTIGGDNSCGVIPDSIDSVSEMFPNASASGHQCVSVPSDQVAGGLWIVEEAFAIDGDRTFYALT